MTYHADAGWLIVRLIPSRRHEVAHRHLGHPLHRTARAMGIQHQELMDLGGTTFRGPTLFKEGDTVFTNPSIRSYETDWPTLVLEVGHSERLSCSKSLCVFLAMPLLSYPLPPLVVRLKG